MAKTAGIKISSSTMGRRKFIKMLGVTSVAATGIGGIIDPFNFARAVITPGEKGIFITDMYRGQLTGCGGVIVRLDTNKGISGYGECRDVDQNSATELSGVRSTVLGMNPTQVDQVFNAIKNYNDPQSDWRYQEHKTGGLCGIETASWDITGKVYNVPIWKLLGHKLRDKIRIYADTAQKNSSTLPAAVQKRLDMGFTWFKADMYLSSLCIQGSDYTVGSSTNEYGYRPITIYSSGYSKMEAYARQYRSLIGNTYPLNSDHYQGYDNFTSQLSVESAIELAYRMAASDCQGMNGGWMEDIIDWGWKDSQGNAAIKQVTAGTDMPILNGEDMYGFEEFQKEIDEGVVDHIHPDQATAGGIHDPRLAGEYASSQGVGTALHCSGGPFSYAASLHVAAGIPDFLALEYHHIDDSCNTWFDTVVDGFVRPFIQSDGHSYVPNGPGLGIAPNAAASLHGLSWTRVT
jgi:L-alanine-DL-glutamate epimerase-like enolase superfamily enzyme